MTVAKGAGGLSHTDFRVTVFLGDVSNDYEDVRWSA